ncbi:MAG: dihydroxyacetone kinase subunit DhaK [Acidimicrobiia bacterium]
MSVRRSKLINDPSRMVVEMLEGYVAAHRHIIRLNEHGHVMRATPKEHGKVALVIGNGSGHEPAMIGWVGPGLFDVNVPGEVFAAPGPSALLAGIMAADRGAGVLLCVSHHAGDLINAEMAFEKAQLQGDHVEMVVLYDDVGSAPKGQEPERRGGAGLFFVWKIVGALAESGAGLAECKAMAERVRDNTRTITAAFGTVAHPVSGERLADLEQDELVVGVGVHGESGVQPGGELTADAVVGRMLASLLDDGEFGAGEEVCVLLNNSGALTMMELSILYRAVDRALAEREIVVYRVWMGSYATTQDLAGFALALCRMDEETKRLYDEPALGAGLAMVAPGRLGAPL